MKLIRAMLISLLGMTLSLPSLAFSEDPIETGTFNNKAIYGFDTVAYFTQNQAVEGNEGIQSEWRGATWYFASTEHKARFDAEPEKYAPQYGGYCAYAMSKGRFVGVDEEAFTIHNNKLYLNYSKSVREDWQEDKDAYIDLADVEYPAGIE
jgi:YHS domain-containing protein